MKEMKNEFFYPCFDDQQFDEVKVARNLALMNSWIEQNVQNGDPELFNKRFHENERRVKCFCEQTIEKDHEPTAELLIDRCANYRFERTVYKIPWLFPNVILIFSNLGLEFILIFLANFIPFKLESSRRAFKCFSLFILFSFNYFFIYFIYQNENVVDFLTKIKYFKSFKDNKQFVTKQFIFELHGDYIQLSMVIEIFRGVINFFVNGGNQIWGLFFSRRRFGIRRKLIKHLTPPEFEIEGRIALMFTLMLVTTFFSCQMPIIVSIGFLIFVILFWGEKFILMMMSSSPLLNCMVPIDLIIHLFPLFSISSIMHTIHTFGNPRVFPTSHFYFFPNETTFNVPYIPPNHSFYIYTNIINKNTFHLSNITPINTP